MSTTSHLQTLPDFYSTIKECEESNRKKVLTNIRYKNFTQTHFTAGDKFQFEEYRDKTNENFKDIDIPINNIFIDSRDIIKKTIEWNGYKELPASCVDNTFSYMFNKFKKGIFVKIKDNKLKVFLPFSKYNFENEWGDLIKFNPSQYKDMNQFLESIASIQNYKFNPLRVNQNTKLWYANNCLVRFEYPLSEGDSGVTHMSDMFKTLCENRKVPDIEFFINRRDFPLLKRNFTEPYDNIFDSDNIPLLSHKYDKYSPIVGGAITKDYADISIPTWKDWARVSAFEGKFFEKTCDELNYELIDKVNWDDKIPTAIFRGTSTGCGVTIDTNPRLKLAYISSITGIEDGYRLLDAGITKWNLRPRKIKGEKYLQTIDITKQPPLVKFMSPYEQCNYKYIINVDGHVTAFRLSLELSMGSVILLADSDYSIWFMKYLIPYTHYVPIKKDLSNIIEIIRWCRSNDDKCKQIAENATNFYKKYLNKDAILDYIQITLINLKSIMGHYFYNITNNLNLQINYELDILKSYKYYPSTTKTILDINEIPLHYLNEHRTYSNLKGLEWLFNFIKLNTESIHDYFNISLDSTPYKETKNTKIYLSNLAKYQTILKYSKEKNIEMIHECFIGHNCINNLSKIIPNFSYTFGSYMYNEKSDSDFSICICSEYIKGITFDTYLRGNFNFKEYLGILVQILLAIYIAQKECAFVHGDLMPWNIIIKKLEKPINIQYVIDHNNIININTDLLIVIIDYGKSHSVYKGIHYGMYDNFKTSTINDSIMILIKSLNVILDSKRIEYNDIKLYLKLANFISNTNYNNKPFTNITELRIFLNNSSKYCNLLTSNKYELESKDPLDLVNYILKIVDIPYIKYINTINYTNKNIGSPKQVFEFILSNTIDDKILTYINVFNSIIECNVSIENNMFFLYYICQTFQQQLNNNYNLLLSFISTIKDESKDSYINKKIYEDLYYKCKNFIEDKFKKNYGSFILKPIELKFDETLYNSNISLFNDVTLLDPIIVYNILLSNKSKKYKDFTGIKNVLENILLNNGMYKLDDKSRTFYISNFEKLLNSKNVYMINNTANICTLREISRKIYVEDKSYILKYDIHNLNIDYIKYYDNIISLTKEIMITLE